MKPAYSVLCLALSFFLMCFQGQAQNTILVYQRHSVNEGDSPSSIAKTYGIPEKEFLQLNNFEQGVNLKPGQVVIVGTTESKMKAVAPSASKEKPAASVKSADTAPKSTANTAQQGKYHIVEPKQTLYRIAVTYGISVDELKRLNNLSSNDIAIGQKLRIAD